MAPHVIGKPGAIAAAGYGVALLGDKTKKAAPVSAGRPFFIQDLNCG
jgi:hypothetical protein